MRHKEPNPGNIAMRGTIDDAMREKWWELSSKHNVPARYISMRFGVNYHTVSTYIRTRKKLATG